jgi:DNA-binding response OmpR family regulator
MTPHPVVDDNLSPICLPPPFARPVASSAGRRWARAVFGAQSSPRLVLLDLMIPKWMDWTSAALRKNSNMPIIMLTAAARLRWDLNLADDYVSNCQRARTAARSKVLRRAKPVSQRKHHYLMAKVVYNKTWKAVSLR